MKAERARKNEANRRSAERRVERERKMAEAGLYVEPEYDLITGWPRTDSKSYRTKYELNRKIA